MKKLALALIPITAFIISLAPGIASATPVEIVTVSNMAYASPTTVHIQFSQGPDKYVYAGAFKTTASDTTGSFLSWCVDIFQRTIFGVTSTDFDRKTSSTAALAPKADTLKALASQSLGNVHDSLTSAAFQLAVWEVVNETSTVYDFSNGSFRANTASDSSISLAQQWLNGLPKVSGAPIYSMSVLQSATKQDLAVFAEVPEPSSIAIFMTGLMGFALARRKFLG